jgi:hypothetical protein
LYCKFYHNLEDLNEFEFYKAVAEYLPQKI